MLRPILVLATLLALSGAAAAGTTDLTGGPPSAEALIRALEPQPLTKSMGTGKDLVPEERRVRLDIPFANNAATLTPAAERALRELATALTSPRLAGTIVRIEGHANRTGSADHNLWLTRARADTVVRFVAGRGVGGGRLSAAGYGFDRPISGLDPRDGRNRRVEIVVVP